MSTFCKPSSLLIGIGDWNPGIRTRPFELNDNGDSMISELPKAQYIVADPLVCHGKWTFRGTRIMVWCVLEQLDSGMPREEIVKEWRGDVSLGAIEEVANMDREVLARRAPAVIHS